MGHSLLDTKDKQIKLKVKEELEAFINNAYEEDANYQLKDVYVTDHTPKDKKFFTINKNEDEQFYKYKKALAEYNSSVRTKEITK